MLRFILFFTVTFLLLPIGWAEDSTDEPISIDSLHLGTSIPKSVDSTESKPTKNDEETCSELYRQIKKSECGQTIFKYLKGASVKVGGALNSSRLEIESNDSTYALLTGLLSPNPYYSLSLASSFFGATRFGYEFSLTYNSSVVVSQNIGRGKEIKSFNLHTYSTISMHAITPSVYFGIGQHDEDPHVNMRFGVGLGLGWAGVRGTAYFTENQEPGNTSCYDLSTDVLNGSAARDSLFEICTLTPYKQYGIGVSGRIFLDWRWHWLYGSFEVVQVGIRSSRYDFLPTESQIKLAYILDI